MFDPKTLELLIQLARQSDAVQVIHPPREPSHVYYLREGEGGALRRIEAEPAPRNHKASDLETLVRFAVEFDAEPYEGRVEIFYSREGVTCYLDGDVRRDRVFLPLTASDQMTALEQNAGRHLSHKDFVKLLRRELGGCTPIELVHALSHVRFQQSQSGEAVAVRGRASIGKTLESQLEGAAPIPELVEVRLPVFESAWPHYRVECLVELDEEKLTFALCPRPGAIEAAYVEAERDLGRTIDRLLMERRGQTEGYQETVRVYYGVP